MFERLLVKIKNYMLTLVMLRRVLFTSAFRTELRFAWLFSYRILEIHRNWRLKWSEPLMKDRFQYASVTVTIM